MRYLLIATTLLMPIAAHAQCCVWANSNLCNAGCSVVGIGGDASVDHSFTTQHKWQPTAPYLLTLDGTAFTIKVDANALTYTLFWREKQLLVSDKLNDAEQLGTAKAVDLQAAGGPLK